MADKMTFEFSLGGTLASSFRGMTDSAQKQIVGLGKSVRTLENSQVGRLGANLEKSRAQVVGLGAELKAAQGRLGALQARAAASGGASASLARQIKSAEGEVKTLTGRLDRGKKAFADNVSVAAQTSGSVKQLRNDYRALSGEIDKARQKQQRLTANLAAREANKSRRAEARAGLFDAVALGMVVAAPVRAAMQFESGMADAAKTIEGMRDETGKLTPMYFEMVRQAKQLGRELPLAHAEIASIMGAAGQQGLTDTTEIAAFTRDSAQMAVAFGMSTEEAAAAIGGYRTALGLAQDDVREMLDLMNYFANTSSASESGISDIVRRVGSLGGVAGVSHKPLAALAATLDSMKVSPEIASTGIQNLMLSMNTGEAATKKQRAVLQDLGLDATELAERMQTDAEGAILDFLSAIKELPKHEQAAALSQFFGRESVKSIAPLLTQLDLLRENFDKTADRSKYLGSMQTEFVNRSATTAGAAQLAKNRLAELGITLGNVLLPPFNTVLGVVGKGASTLADLSERFPLFTKVVGTAAASVISLAVASKALAYGYTFVKGGLLLAEGALLRMTGAQVANDVVTKRSIIMQKAWAGALAVGRMAVMGVTLATRAMNLVMRANPLGLALTAVAAIAGVIVAKFGLIGRFVDWLGKKYDQWFGDGESIDIGDSTSIDATLAGDRDKPETLAGSNVESMAAQAADNLAKFNFDDSVAGAEPLGDFDYSGLGAGAMSINVEMPVSVEMGLDSAAFKSKLLEHRPELESCIAGLMRKIMEELAHENRRTSYAY